MERGLSTSGASKIHSRQAPVLSISADFALSMMASRRAPNPPAPTHATTSPIGDGGGAETYASGGDLTSRPPLTPLMSRTRTGSRDDYGTAGIFRTPQQQNHRRQHGRGAASSGVSSSGSGGTPRQQRGVHSLGSGGGTPSPSSARSSASHSPPSYRGSRRPVQQYSRSYGSAGSPNSAGSSMATPRRRGGVGGSAGVGVPPYRRSPSSPADGDSTSGAEFDPYLEVPNLGHADNTMPLYYGTNGGGSLHGGLMPLYDSGGRSNGENGIRGGHHRHAGIGHHGNAESHHNTSIPLCSRKRTRRRAAACVAVVGLIGAQYLYAIQVGSAEVAGGSTKTTSAAVEAVAAAVTGAVNDLLGAANGGSGAGGIGDVIAGITSGLGGTDDATSNDENVSDDTKEVLRFTTGTSPTSNSTVARQNRSRQKQVKKGNQRAEFRIPRLLFIGSNSEEKTKKGRKGGGPSLAHLFESVERLGKKQRNGTSSSFVHWNKVGRKVKIYPAEQTDETQMYPEIDSADPPFNETILVRSFPPRKGDYFLGSERDVGVGCRPMADWQSAFHPTCNSFHDIDAGDAMQNSALSFLGAGHWRGAWSFLEEDADKPVVYKTWSYEHRFEDFYYELNRIDAVAMERLTSSPYAINIYGLCGTSSITQFATETLTSVADSLDSLGKLKLVRKIAKGLSHVHGIGGDNHHASLVHNDLNTAHILLDSDGKTPLIHDFNVAQLLLRDNKEKPCGFASEHWSPQWRSPEEIRSFQSIEHEMLTEKVDLYSLGNIIYRFLTGQRAWRLGEGSMTEEYQRDIAKWKSEEGKTPSVPESVLELRDNDEYVDALLSLMDRCFAFKPSDRPSAKEIVRTIDRLMQSKNEKRH